MSRLTIWEVLSEAVAAADEPFTRQELLSWVARHHPDTNLSSVGTHLEQATSNAPASSKSSTFARRTPLVIRIDHGRYVRYAGDPVTSEADGTVTAQPGSSAVQRDAENVMLARLGDRLGVLLEPRRLEHPSGAAIEVDGVAPDRSVLVECWAHQGAAKVAQKYKLVNDATKLNWAATWLEPKPDRLILCVTDEAAVRHLRGRSWQGKAIESMGVEIEVVDLPEGVLQNIAAAQKRQYR